ncbi:MAG: hypothetical protein JKY32_07810 [Rhizobiales bacterium]|nr:hypothetical protein [Hyphomicrobiales bacterium]
MSKWFERGISIEFLGIDDGSDGAITLLRPEGTKAVGDFALDDFWSKGALATVVGCPSGRDNRETSAVLD